LPANTHGNKQIMENDFREKQRKSYNVMRVTYDLTMAILILAIGCLLVFGDKFGNKTLKEFVTGLDPLLRYMFGTLCLLYGGFRMYRGIKQDY
jgi:hypothetical protein